MRVQVAWEVADGGQALAGSWTGDNAAAKPTLASLGQSHNPLRARALRSGGRRDSDAAARFLRQAHPNAA
jgi:hypothetical protein